MTRKGAADGIAVAIHDVEPATWERCALIRDWLSDHGVERATLLVIPARDLHPLGGRSPEMSSWLIGRRAEGDSIAQHGFQHERLGARPRARMRLLGAVRRREGEFAGLDELQTRRTVDAGWRVLKLAGIEPDGFVAPSYLYTPQLRRVLPLRFRWWATLLRIEYAPATEATEAAESTGRRERGLTPAWSVGAPSSLGRLIAPSVIRVGARVAGNTLRVDVHPTTLEYPRQVRALESVLVREGRRRKSLTLGELPEPGGSAAGNLPGTPAAV
jgi:predicted deacetylase